MTETPQSDRMHWLSAAYNRQVARGWESKSIEAQQADALDMNSTVRRKLSPAETARQRQSENLRMARTRIVRQLESVSDPRYRAQLEQSLKELERKLKDLTGA